MSVQYMTSNSSLDFSNNFISQGEIATNYNNRRKSQPLKKLLKQTPVEDYTIEKNPSTDCSSDSDQAQKTKTDETKYKTEMCKNFQTTGFCNYGKKCKFAHGKQDLVNKPIQGSKTYKTKTCKAFHEELNCPYGSRCHFKHDQRNLQEIQSSKFYAKKLATLDINIQAILNNGSKTPKTTISQRLPFFQSLNLVE